MKKCFRGWILVGLCIFTLLLGSAIAETYDLDEALALVGTSTDDMLELNEDLSEIDPFSGSIFQSTGGKSIIIWREGPEKEFETSATPITEDYEGTDLEEGHTFLCARLMEKMPEKQRAKTSDEIENVLVVETSYLISGVITSQMGSDSSDLPSPEELMEIEREISSEEVEDAESMDDTDNEITLMYKPVYNCIEICYVYNLPSRSSAVLDYEIYENSELRKNPRASDLWNQLLTMWDLLKAQETQNASAMQAVFQEGNYSEFLSEEDYQALAEEVTAGDVAGAMILGENIFWDMAEGLKTLDVLVADLYGQIIEARSYRALGLLANRRAYSSVEKTDMEIRLTKAYLGRPDLTKLDSMLQDAFELLNYADWDMELVSMAVNSEA